MVSTSSAALSRRNALCETQTSIFIVVLNTVKEKLKILWEIPVIIMGA